MCVPPIPRHIVLSEVAAAPARRHSAMLISHSQNSNVVKFFSLLKRDDRREQMVYYQVRGAAPENARSRS